MQRTVEILGAPTDFGANRRGVDMGPSAIRYAGLVDRLTDAGVDCIDSGDLFGARTARSVHDEDASASASTSDPGDDSTNGTGMASDGDLDVLAPQLPAVLEAASELADRVARTISSGRFPLVLGGDHSIAIGTLNGAAREAPTGVLWFDAHGDFNTPSTSPSGNVHGMALAAVLGRDEFARDSWAHVPTLSEEHVVLVGVRDLDEGERVALRESDVTVYTMSDLDARGVSAVVEEALDVATDGVSGLHVSLDLDWLDPSVAPGVGTPVRGGVTYREAHAALELVAERDASDRVLRSLELVEVNPILDLHNETAELATELAASALGKRIL